MSGERVLVIDDSEGIRSYVASFLELQGFDVDTAEDGRRALALLDSGLAPDAIVLDVLMTGLGGLETLRGIRERDPEVPVIMLSVIGKAATIVEAMKLGADDYLNKPFEEEELTLTLRSALERREPLAERDPRVEIGEPGADALWEGPSLSRIRATLEQISDTDVTVMIQGESGVGKEIVARAVHATSTRKEGPFVKVNCAALPGTLLESELFGYEKGAFTGAAQRRAGKFEAAHGGTMFLDEIGEMSPALQAKLLHVLQDGSFSRVGGNEELRVDVRVVTATHRALDRMVAQGQFREDLYFRLNVVTLQIPPLRERRDEIPTLIEHFLARFTVRYGKPRRTLSPRLLRLLERYPFPGNIRELENMVRRVVVLESEDSILNDLLAGGERGAARSVRAFQNLLEEVEETAGDMPLREVGRRASQEAEREAIERVLFETGWNRKQAARLLKVSYKTLLQKIRECGIEPG
jgi:DNA-binding NtrC family response regulator